MPSISDILAGKGICICAGSGGVGRTTTSAAIAAGMAARGRKGLRFDDRPGQAARRLARAQGAGQRGRVESTRGCRAQGIELEGELWAMMLDAKATFDELVARHGARRGVARPGPRKPHLPADIQRAGRLPGIHGDGEAVRAPCGAVRPARARHPADRNALDFLEAPRRLTQFIEGRSLRVFMRPPGWRPGRRTRRDRRPLGVFKRIVGFDLLADLAEFFNSVQRHGRRLPGPGQAGQRAARRSGNLLPGRLRPAGGADRRSRLLPPQAGRGEAALRGRHRQQGPLPGRAAARQRRGLAAALAGRSANRAWRAGGGRTSSTTRRWPTGPRNIERLAAELRTRA